MKSYYRFVSIVTTLTALILIVSCSQKEEDIEVTDNEPVKQIDLADPSDSLIYEMVGVDSMTVLDVLLQQYDVKYMSSLQGAYVTRIDDVPNEGGYFWMYSVNGEMGAVACDKYTTKEGDRIRWHYRMAGTLQM
ncbi:MAG: DUF4430 domain-containing protein [candidate division Zixibacteria bacterium]|nr:DUF4430 domain-containing protein [candidate division Zixibacteria bacterium]MDH3938768.1 DUF4430 domain-containing protein [candidate division Zixibacteria bacterium]MDH4035373.1 DUF4430 domain-containing protein [candidate division Zixibacteria bacterium]